MAGFGERKESNRKASRKKSQVSGKSHLKNAISHHMNGDLVNAEIGYREAIKAGYLDDKMFVNLGIICRNTGRSD